MDTVFVRQNVRFWLEPDIRMMWAALKLRYTATVVGDFEHRLSRDKSLVTEDTRVPIHLISLSASLHRPGAGVLDSGAGSEAYIKWGSSHGILSRSIPFFCVWQTHQVSVHAPQRRRFLCRRQINIILLFDVHVTVTLIFLNN